MSIEWPTRPPGLNNGDLVLRGRVSTDAEAVYVACQDPEIQRWTTVPVPYERHHASGFVDEAAAEQWATSRGAPLCISDPRNRVLGACGLADWAFERGLCRPELLIEPCNIGSIAAAERAGCVREGLLRRKATEQGERRDMLLYAIVS